MPRDYDKIRDAEDRDFIVRGEKFTVRHVGVSVLDQIDKLQQEFIDKSPETYQAAVEFAQDRLMLLIDDSNGAVARWKALAEREEDPVSYGEIMDLSRWAFEQVTGLPTIPPASSAPTPKKTAPTSTGA